MKGLTQQHLAACGLLLTGGLMLFLTALLPWGYVGVLWISGLSAESWVWGLFACLIGLACLGAGIGVLFIDTRPWARRIATFGALALGTWMMLLPGIIHSAARIHAGIAATTATPVSSGAGAFTAALATALLYPGFGLAIASRSRNWMVGIPIGLAIAVFAVLSI